MDFLRLNPQIFVDFQHYVLSRAKKIPYSCFDDAAACSLALNVSCYEMISFYLLFACEIHWQ